MIKTQIQLPDTLYRDLKKLSSSREWSLAETMRRAAEQFLKTHPVGETTHEAWQLPEAKRCGPFMAPIEEWTVLTHED